MVNKRVVDYDTNFRGFRVGDLVRPRSGITFLDWRGCGLVIDRTLHARMLGEGDGEYYDPVLVVVSSGKRHVVHVGDVEKVEDGIR